MSEGLTKDFLVGFSFVKNMIKKKFKIFIFTIVFFIYSAFFVLAQITNDSVSNQVMNFSSASNNYQFDAEIGAPAVGESESNNFIFEHGAIWGDENNYPFAKSKWLIQSSRDYRGGDNDAMIFYLTFKQNGNVIYTTTLATSSSKGEKKKKIELNDLTPGIYDVYVKGFQTITKKYSNVNIQNGENIFNFTQNDISSTTKGNVKLISGDITEAGTSTLTLGNDFINTSDIGVILGNYGSLIPFFRADLDQNNLVNTSDIGIILGNYSKEGDQ